MSARSRISVSDYLKKNVRTGSLLRMTNGYAIVMPESIPPSADLTVLYSGHRKALHSNGKLINIYSIRNMHKFMHVEVL